MIAFILAWGACAANFPAARAADPAIAPAVTVSSCSERLSKPPAVHRQCTLSVDAPAAGWLLLASEPGDVARYRNLATAFPCSKGVDGVVAPTKRCEEVFFDDGAFVAFYVGAHDGTSLTYGVLDFTPDDATIGAWFTPALTTTGGLDVPAWADAGQGGTLTGAILELPAAVPVRVVYKSQ